ncbi:hypothetical protein KB205_02725 [Microvirga sp. STS03]|uniref:hypothetical protein n=1 Tax=Pontibacter TaxID=323449 RepID=UPI001B828674|nr:MULTISPECIES: hypothetical protein [Pontibacter]MBR0569513.1 hypothetical protein [Microvirga sp. STS03]
MRLSTTIVILCLLLLTAVTSVAQQPEATYIRTIAVGSSTAISTGTNNAVYLLNPRRNIVQLDSLGRLVTLYSPTSNARITTIDAWNPMKVLAFYADRQELLLLDRFLTPITSVALADFEINNTVKAAALAADDGFWLFDETDFKLSKLDLRLRKVTIETPLNLVMDRNKFDIRMLREYQNQVYLLDYNSGIYVFDNLGNYKQRLPLTGISYIGFLNDELYFVKEVNLHFYDLYKHEQRTIAFPEGKNYTTALATKNRLYLFSGKAADVYSW